METAKELIEQLNRINVTLSISVPLLSLSAPVHYLSAPVQFLSAPVIEPVPDLIEPVPSLIEPVRDRLLNQLPVELQELMEHLPRYAQPPRTSLYC